MHNLARDNLISLHLASLALRIPSQPFVLRLLAASHLQLGCRKIIHLVQLHVFKSDVYLQTQTDIFQSAK